MVDTKKAQEYVGGVVKEEADRVRNLTIQAARSGAYLFPLKGIVYYASHRDLWKPLLSRLGPILVTSVSVFITMFGVTYVPQAALLALFNGPLAIVSTTLLVFNESALIINAICRDFFLQDALVDTFDAVLLANGKTDLVSSGRQINRGSHNPVGKLGKLIKRPFAKFSPAAFIRYLMYLPLNLIPGVGVLIFIGLQGRNVGPASHRRYFQLKNWDERQRNQWLSENKAQYTSFGVAQVLLEMIPFVSIILAFTNTVGAALWAVKLENEGDVRPAVVANMQKTE